MKVVIDTNTLYVTRAGTARYVNGLLSGLATLRAQDLQLERLAWPVENLGYNQPTRMLKTAYRELVWTHLFAPTLLRRQAPDILHSPDRSFLTPPKGSRSVVTIHDFALMAHPERYRIWQRWSGRNRLLQSGAADRIICVSQFTADETMRLLGVPRGRIDVIHNASDLTLAQAVPRWPDDLHIPEDFLLFVGSLEPGKNLGLLRETYRLAAERRIPLPDLIIVGARWHGVPHEGTPPPNWRFLGRQPDDVLVRLYAHAVALVFPSKYEGFGLPPLEAMSLGCPVICSAVASLPEVVGDAALLPPLTPDGYLDEIRHLLKDHGLRAELQAKGRERAKRFSWEKCAQQTLECYRTTLAH